MIDFENRRWVVMPSSDLEIIDYSQISEDSEENIRFSNDRSEFFVKFDIGENYAYPSFIKPEHRVMTYMEIMEYIDNEMWIPFMYEFPIE